MGRRGSSKVKLTNTGTNAFKVELPKKSEKKKVVEPIQIDVEDIAPAKNKPVTSVGRKGGGSSVESNVPLKNGLEPAWVGWPRHERHCIYFSGPDDKMLCYHKFAATYAAKKFCMAISDLSTWRLIDNFKIQLNEKVSVSADTAAEIFKHKLTKQEEAWVLPVPYDTYAANIAGVQSPAFARLEAAKATAYTAMVKGGAQSQAAPGKPAVQRGAVIHKPAKVRAPTMPKAASDATIHLKQKGNPCKEGTKSHALFACFKEEMTVAEFIKLGQPGCNMPSVTYFAKRGYIEVKEPKE